MKMLGMQIAAESPHPSIPEVPLLLLMHPQHSFKKLRPLQQQLQQEIAARKTTLSSSSRQVMALRLVACLVSPPALAALTFPLVQDQNLLLVALADHLLNLQESAKHQQPDQAPQVLLLSCLHAPL